MSQVSRVCLFWRILFSLTLKMRIKKKKNLSGWDLEDVTSCPEKGFFQYENNTLHG